MGVGGLWACDDERGARRRQDRYGGRIQPAAGADQAAESLARGKRNIYAGPAGVIVIAKGRAGMLVVIVVIVPLRREAG